MPDVAVDDRALARALAAERERLAKLLEAMEAPGDGPWAAGFYRAIEDAAALIRAEIRGRS